MSARASLLVWTLALASAAHGAELTPASGDPSAQLSSGSVGMLPPLVLGVEGASQAELANVLTAAAPVALGARLRALPLVASCDPLVESRCLADEIEKVPGVAVVAQLSLERGAHAWLLRLRIFGRDGQLIGERRVPTDEVDAGRAARGVLVDAFDPAGHKGRVVVRGVRDDARVTLDGATVAAKAAAGVLTLPSVPAGKHVLAVERDGGAEAQTYAIVVEHDRTTEVLADPALAAAVAPGASGAPGGGASVLSPIAIGGVVAGLAAVAGGLGTYILSSETRDEWRRRAEGRSFPRNADDPQCAATGCVNADQVQTGWTAGYGPLGEDQQVGQGARFMMIAISRDNELRWGALNQFAITAGIAGAILTVASTVTLLVVPSDEPGAFAGAGAGE